MQFDWDDAKRVSNLARHGFDFVDAETVFSSATFTFEDDRFAFGEQRFITLGMLRGVVVVISMRKATRHERRIYFRSFTD